MATRRNTNSEIPMFSKLEEEGLYTMKRLIEDYLHSNKVRKDSKLTVYLAEALIDEHLLMSYIRGRKGQLDAAWDTLRRYAENRFIHYPEVFPHSVPQTVWDMLECHAVGALKNRDIFGRRIIFFDMSKWDLDLYNIDDLTSLAVVAAETFWKDPDVLENGIVLLQTTRGFGVGHAKEHSINKMLRMKNLFHYSYPISIQAMFYLHMPYMFTLVVKMTKHLIPKKMRSRMSLYTPNETPTELYDIAPPEILPTWAGGKLSVEEAAEPLSFFQSRVNTTR